MYLKRTKEMKLANSPANGTNEYAILIDHSVFHSENK